MSALLLFALAAAATPALSASPDSKPVRERKICKTETPIGTLAGRKRVCHTAAEWREIAARARDSYRDLQGAQGSTRSVEPDLTMPMPPPQ